MSDDPTNSVTALKEINYCLHLHSRLLDRE